MALLTINSRVIINVLQYQIVCSDVCMAAVYMFSIRDMHLEVPDRPTGSRFVINKYWLWTSCVSLSSGSGWNWRRKIEKWKSFFRNAWRSRTFHRAVIVQEECYDANFAEWKNIDCVNYVKRSATLLSVASPSTGLWFTFAACFIFVCYILMYKTK